MRTGKALWTILEDTKNYVLFWVLVWQPETCAIRFHPSNIRFLIDYLNRTGGLGHSDSLGKAVRRFSLHFFLFMSGAKVISVVVGARTGVHVLLPAADSAGVRLWQRMEGQGGVLYWCSLDGFDIQFNLWLVNLRWSLTDECYKCGGMKKKSWVLNFSSIIRKETHCVTDVLCMTDHVTTKGMTSTSHEQKSFAIRWVRKYRAPREESVI